MPVTVLVADSPGRERSPFPLGTRRLPGIVSYVLSFLVASSVPEKRLDQWFVGPHREAWGRMANGVWP